MSSTRPEHRANPAMKEAADNRQSAVGPSSGGSTDPDMPRFPLSVTGSIYQSLFEWLLYLSLQQQRNTNLILQRIDIMATAAVTRADLDNVLTQAVTEVNQAFADLEAKIAAGTVTTPEDFSAEVAQLKTILSTAVGADPGPASTGSTSTSAAASTTGAASTPAPASTAS